MLAGLSLCFSLTGQNILFIGNSLTYSNNLPAMVKAIGKEMGRNIKTTCLCYPNYGLEDHWTDGKLQKLLNKEKFNFVVFQQGPSSQAYGRESLIAYGGSISQLAKKHGAQPAYFMVWPSLQYYQTFEGVIKNYRAAAIENEALLIPFGAHWQAYRQTTNTINLYGNDGFHPSKAGSFFAALFVYHELIPDTDLSTLKHEHFRKWVNEENFREFLNLVNSR